MSSVILPCSSLLVDFKDVTSESLVVSIQVQGAMVVMAIIATDLPHVTIRLERDAYACRMSDPLKIGAFAVMVLDVNLVRPLSSEVMSFWGKRNNGRAMYPRLRILFNQKSTLWSPQAYDVFVQSARPNFLGNLWQLLGFTRPDESKVAWEQKRNPQRQKMLLTPNLMQPKTIERLDKGGWLNCDIVNFALEKSCKELLQSERIWVSNTFFLSTIRNGLESTLKWFRENHLDDKYWIIPGYENSHWFLIVVAHPYRCKDVDNPFDKRLCMIIVMDSFYDHPMHSKDERALKCLIKALVEKTGFRTIKHPTILRPKVIKQQNSDDCGIYAVHFARLWMQDPDSLLNAILDNSKGVHEIWKSSCIPDLRSQLRGEIMNSAEGGWFKLQSDIV